MNDNAPDPTPESPQQPAREGGSSSTAAELAALQRERDALQEQLKRSLADIANVRRRHVKEMEAARETALEGLARELLPVLDNFHYALEAHEQHTAGEARPEAHAFVEGLHMVRSLLEGVLERHGVREIEGHGHPFDPNKHEAVGLDAAADVEPGHVAKVLQRGYLLSDRVLRPSRVLVRDQNAPSPQPREGGAGQSAGGTPEE
jgi:molecular chaperone GrpE